MVDESAFEAIDSTHAKLVLAYLETHGPVTIESLKSRLNLPLLQLYPAVNRLEERGYVVERPNGLAVPDSVTA